MKTLVIFCDDQFDAKTGGVKPTAERIFDEFCVVNDPDKLIPTIQSHTDKLICIVLDYKFENKKGVNATSILKKIREVDKKIPVILWTANAGTIDKDYQELINNSINFVIKKTEPKKLYEALEECASILKYSIAELLETVLIKYEKMFGTKPYMLSASGQVLSAKDLLEAVRLQNETGKEIERKINQLAIDLLLKEGQKVEK